MMLLDNKPSPSPPASMTSVASFSMCLSSSSSSSPSSSSSTEMSQQQQANKEEWNTSETSTKQSWIDGLKLDLDSKLVASLIKLVELGKLEEQDLNHKRVQQSLNELCGKDDFVQEEFCHFLERDFMENCVASNKRTIELMKESWRTNSLDELDTCKRKSRETQPNGFGLTHHESFDDHNNHLAVSQGCTRLLEIIDKWKERQQNGGQEDNKEGQSVDAVTIGIPRIINFMTPSATTHYPGPNEERLKEILTKSGYPLELSNGQRKYGPPPDYNETLANGCEIFVGRIAKDVFEDELIPLFESIGTIYDLRLMIDPATGCSRGYAFITFFTPEHAKMAVKQFDNHCLRPNKPIRVNISVPNMRLFIGNIPKEMSKEEIFQEFMSLTTGLKDVIVYKLPTDRKRNRGFCFLEFDTHKHASMARRRLMAHRIKIWGAEILVDWAEPLDEPDEETMAQVKVLYVRNIGNVMSDAQIFAFFGTVGPVERVKRIRDYAFVHFETREKALEAMERFNDTEIGGGVHIEISLAKPPWDRKRREEILRNRERRLMNTSQAHARAKHMSVYPSEYVPMVASGSAYLASSPPLILSASGAGTTQPLIASVPPFGGGAASGGLLGAPGPGLLSPGSGLYHHHHQLCASIPVAPVAPVMQPTYHSHQHHHYHHPHQQQQQQQQSQLCHQYSQSYPHQYANVLPIASPVLRVTLGTEGLAPAGRQSPLKHATPSKEAKVAISCSSASTTSTSTAAFVSGHLAFQVPSFEAAGVGAQAAPTVYYNYLDPNWAWYLQQLAGRGEDGTSPHTSIMQMNHVSQPYPNRDKDGHAYTSMHPYDYADSSPMAATITTTTTSNTSPSSFSLKPKTTTASHGDKWNNKCHIKHSPPGNI